MSQRAPAKSKPARRNTEATMWPLVKRYLSSGLSQKAFCREHHLSYAVFRYWLQKYQKSNAGSSQAEKPAPKAAFVPIHVAPPASISPLCCELVFPNGIVLRLTQPVETDLLIQLIRNGA